MKKFDFENINKYIELNKDIIDEITLGMLEDFWWTAFVYYKNEEFVETQSYRLEDSTWATPVMLAEYKNISKPIIIDCYIDDGIITNQSDALKDLITSGACTKDCTEYLSKLERFNLEDLL